MKKLFIVLAFVFTVTSVLAQEAEVSRDANGSKTLKGFISYNSLSTDTAFSWFAANQKYFVPDANAVQVLKAKKDSIEIIAFGGTWCDDTKQLLPQFFSLTNAAGYPSARITLLGVDREKKTTHNLSEAFGVTLVPTFIIMKNGKEVGRVVEYGKYGSPVKEIGEIIQNAFKN